MQEVLRAQEYVDREMAQACSPSSWEDGGTGPILRESEAMQGSIRPCLRKKGRKEGGKRATETQYTLSRMRSCLVFFQMAVVTNAGRSSIWQAVVGRGPVDAAELACSSAVWA